MIHRGSWAFIGVHGLSQGFRVSQRFMGFLRVHRVSLGSKGFYEGL